MDTTPFHLILFALDILVWGGLFLWIRFRRNRVAEKALVYCFEKSLYAPVVVRRASLVWDIAGVFLVGSFGLVCFAVLAWLMTFDYVQEHIYHFNVGQCIVEGVAVHGTLFLCVVAVLLFWNRRRFCALFSGLCALVLAAFSFNVLYWEPYHLRVEHYTVKTAKLTKPLRIVFVSDIQTDRVGSHELNTLKTIQKQKADLIILGGDYVQTFGSALEKPVREALRQLLLEYPLEAPLGVYAVKGNIGGIGTLNDTHLFNGTSVKHLWRTTVLPNIGEDEGWEPPIDLILLSTAHSSGGLVERDLIDSGNFVVMAGHYPNYAVDGYTDPETGKPLSGYKNAEKAPDLMLAGHTHGGQIVLPFYGPLPKTRDLFLQQVPRSMWSGLFSYPNGGHLLVTRGSGMERGWAPRMRLFCPAEISVIDIVPE